MDFMQFTPGYDEPNINSHELSMNYHRDRSLIEVIGVQNLTCQVLKPELCAQKRT